MYKIIVTMKKFSSVFPHSSKFKIHVDQLKKLTQLTYFDNFLIPTVDISSYFLFISVLKLYLKCKFNIGLMYLAIVFKLRSKTVVFSY